MVPAQACTVIECKLNVHLTPPCCPQWLQLYRVTGQCGNQHMSRWSCQGAVIWNNHHNVILFCHSSLWPTEGLNVTRVEKNDIPIIIMTNYDQLEFFNLWIWGPTADRLICFSLLLIWQAIKNNWEKISWKKLFFPVFISQNNSWNVYNVPWLYGWYCIFSHGIGLIVGLTGRNKGR